MADALFRQLPLGFEPKVIFLGVRLSGCFPKLMCTFADLFFGWVCHLPIIF